jgi:hypothetical protein
MEEFADFYTRQYVETYDETVVEKLNALFDDDTRTTEAFFAIHSQIDALAERYDIDLWRSEYRDRDTWTVDVVLAAVDEIVTFARTDNMPCWTVMLAMSTAMRMMVELAPFAPSSEFVDIDECEPDLREESFKGALQDAQMVGNTQAAANVLALMTKVWPKKSEPCQQCGEDAVDGHECQQPTSNEAAGASP